MGVYYYYFPFSALMLLAGWQERHSACEKMSVATCICLGQGADLHIAQLMPLPPTLLLQ